MLLTRSPLIREASSPSPFDLHVLSTPPAFVLSQDQTLRKCLIAQDPKAVIPHAALLRQAFAHCAIFPTAASRRSLGRISVPVWPIALSGRLPVDALVSHYLTN